MSDEQPRLEKIADGYWSAHGDGWAVHAPTEAEALEKYKETLALHREILSRPAKVWEREEEPAPTGYRAARGVIQLAPGETPASVIRRQRGDCSELEAKLAAAEQTLANLRAAASKFERTLSSRCDGPERDELLRILRAAPPTPKEGE